MVVERKVILIILLGLVMGAISGCISETEQKSSVQIPLSNTKFKILVTEITTNSNYLDFSKEVVGWYDLNGQRNEYYKDALITPDKERSLSKILVTNERAPILSVRGWGGPNGVYFVDVEQTYGFRSKNDIPLQRAYLIEISYIPFEISHRQELELYCFSGPVLRMSFG